MHPATPISPACGADNLLKHIAFTRRVTVRWWSVDMRADKWSYQFHYENIFVYAAQIKRLQFYTQKSKCRFGHRIKTRARSTMNSNIAPFWICALIFREVREGDGGKLKKLNDFFYIIYAMSCCSSILYSDCRKTKVYITIE